MANYSVFNAQDWDFLCSHPDVVWEADKPVYYRTVPGVAGGPSIQRFDIYLSLDPK